MSVGRVLVTGAAGQLGSAVLRAFADVDVTAHTRTTLDIADGPAVEGAVASVRPQAIVNCAAFNDVDGAEGRPADALSINGLAVRNLARAAERVGATLVHYGTDFVFDGRATSPYTEDARPSPQGTYAASKLIGEWFALEAPRAFVLRVESLFGTPPGWTGRRGTIDGIVDRLRHGQEVRAFTDRVVSPGYVVDIASATRFLVDSTAAPGLYHCVNTGHTTWFGLVTELASLLGVTPRLTAVTTDQVTLRAARPRYCALSTTKLAAAGFEMPTWQDALRRWLFTRGTPAT